MSGSTPRITRESPRAARESPQSSHRDDIAERDIEAGADEPLLAPPRQTEEPVLSGESQTQAQDQAQDQAQPQQPQQQPVEAPAVMTTEVPTANRDYVPVRTDPIEGLDARTVKRRLDRQVNDRVPEIHIVGRIASGKDLVNDISEGAFCRWKVAHGKAWQHLGGELIGQTQVGYCSGSVEDKILFEHPIDLHFACAGLQGWGALRIAVQCFRFDFCSRRILAGYGFAHIPCTPGVHKVDVTLWRPMGTMEQEMKAFLLGEVPCLVSQDALYESAWKDRCRLITTSSGSVSMEVFVMTRYWQDQGLQT